MNYIETLKAGRIVSGGKSMPNPYKLGPGRIPVFGRSQQRENVVEDRFLPRFLAPAPEARIGELDEEDVSAVQDSLVEEMDEVAEDEIVDPVASASLADTADAKEDSEDEPACKLPLLLVACKRGTNAYRRREGWFRRLYNRFRRSDKPDMAQAEFDFTEVRVERNDLFDADLQLIQVPRNSVGGTAGGPGSTASWGIMAKRIFGADSNHH